MQQPLLTEVVHRFFSLLFVYFYVYISPAVPCRGRRWSHCYLKAAPPGASPCTLGRAVVWWQAARTAWFVVLSAPGASEPAPPLPRQGPFLEASLPSGCTGLPQAFSSESSLRSLSLT